MTEQKRVLKSRYLIVITVVFAVLAYLFLYRNGNQKDYVMSGSEQVGPGPGQESVWDYPAPPRVEPSSKQIKIIFNGEVIADTHKAVRLLEKGIAPVYYIPLADIKMQYLQKTSLHTTCPYKGQAGYYTIKVGDKTEENAAWFYPSPPEHFSSMKDFIAVYPGKMDACFVGEEQIAKQGGSGWMTKDIYRGPQPKKT